MIAMATAVTATMTEEIEIDPALRAKLQIRLKRWTELQRVARLAAESADAAKEAVGEVHTEIGRTSLTVDGYTVTEVRSIRTELNKEKLLAMGVTTTMLAEATESKPNKSYLKITEPRPHAV